jgi:glucose/arabinose dehydrogenase
LFAKLVLDEAERAGSITGIKIQPIMVRGPDEELDAAFAAMTREPADAIVIQGSLSTKRIADLALQHRLPAAEQRTGHLTLLRDADGDGKADFIERYADDFKAPYGLAYRDGFVLVADQEGIWRVPHVTGALRGGRPDQPKITDVPPEQRKPVPAAYGQELITQRGVFGVIAGHQNRHLALDPKTGAMFVGVGSSGNIGVEPEVKASIQRFEPDGSGQTTFASGMRNPTRSHSTPPRESFMPAFRSEMGSATIFRPIT